VQGYSYQHVNNAWICQKCSALVDDPSLHEDSHQELVTVLRKWTELLERSRDIGDAEISDITMYGVPQAIPVTDGVQDAT
jgi:hypothetical protein